MTKEKMTIHKALSELKVLNDRIEKKITDLSICRANRNSNKLINGKKIDEWKQENKDKYASVNDLINRRYAMKRAIVMSNAITEVEVGEAIYKVAEAIEMKNSGIELKNAILRTLYRQYGAESKKCEMENAQIPQNVERYIVERYGGDTKNRGEDAKKEMDDYIKNNTFEIVQVIDCNKEIERLEKEIDKFMSDVDSALSVSNATTSIEFEY